MLALSPSDRRFAHAVSKLTFCNPFLPERITLEKEAFGDDFVDAPLVWSMRPEDVGERPAIQKLLERVGPLADRLRDKLAGSGRGPAPAAADLELYEDVAVCLLYHRFRGDLEAVIDARLAGPQPAARVPCWRRFAREFDRSLRIPGRTLPSSYAPAHLFACFFQVRRAFRFIFYDIIGGSMPAARLRASIWQSIFTHDLKRYARVLYRHMGDMSTLVTGPSGTGKELVARAIGRSRFIPFDAGSERFAGDFAGSFFPLNLSALSPTLIESELFGHRRGAFTGAVSDRTGWLEVCPETGTVFLDEIGEVDAAIQVKLLRVLESRRFQRLGDTADRRFPGKIVTATNRDLARELREGRFREDLYYRLCSDMLTTPPLREELADMPGDLRSLVLFIARRIVGDEAEAVADEVVAWIDEHLGREYQWPGNIRELEQCVCNVVIRRRYEPHGPRPRGDDAEELARELRGGRLTADELLSRYCTIVYAQAGTYEEAGRRLGLDRRTVKARVLHGGAGT